VLVSVKATVNGTFPEVGDAEKFATGELEVLPNTALYALISPDP